MPPALKSGWELILRADSLNTGVSQEIYRRLQACCSETSIKFLLTDNTCVANICTLNKRMPFVKIGHSHIITDFISMLQECTALSG